MRFFNSCSSKFWEWGDEVFTGGLPAQFMYFIVRGRVATYCLDTQDKKRVHLFVEGSHFGVNDIIKKRKRQETVYAEEDTELWLISAKDIMQIMA